MRINTFFILLSLFIFNCAVFNNIKKNEGIYKEKEYKNSKGLNDKFEMAENITFNNRIMGYIGAESDIDNYLINIKEEGILNLKIDISKSFSEKKIFFLVLTVYSGNWLGSNTASCATDPGLPDNYIIDKDNIKYSNNSIEIKQSVNAKHDKYFIRINVIGGNDKYKEFDIDNPYVLTVNFTPGKTLESDQPDKNSGINDADIYDDANKITFNNDNYGTSLITSYAYYWYDIDWYYFKADYDGWLRVTIYLLEHEDNDPHKTVINMLCLLYTSNDEYFNKEEFRIISKDSPGCPYTYNEFTNIKRGKKYYLKFFCFEYSKIKPYKIKIEYYPGDPEDKQPGNVKSSNEPIKAYNMGIIHGDEIKKTSSYFFHYFDYDYYKIKTAKNIDGEVNIILDYNDTYKKYGWYDELSCYKNPYGIKTWLYVYKASMLEKIKDTNSYIYCSVKNFSSFQKITFFSVKNTAYYILVNSRANWDTENPYTLTVSYIRNKKEMDFDKIAKKIKLNPNYFYSLLNIYFNSF